MDAKVPVLVEVKGITGMPRDASSLQVTKYLIPRMRTGLGEDIVQDRERVGGAPLPVRVAAPLLEPVQLFEDDDRRDDYDRLVQPSSWQQGCEVAVAQLVIMLDVDRVSGTI